MNKRLLQSLKDDVANAEAAVKEAQEVLQAARQELWYAEREADLGPLGLANSEDVARVLAASYDLLEACKVAVNFMSQDDPGSLDFRSRIFEQIRAAISRAEGSA